MNNIYDSIETSNIYGLNYKNETTDRLLYLLDKVSEISNRELLGKFEQTQIENERELNNTVNSKYPYYKNKEPRSVNGSGLKMKKQFRFNRK